MATALITGVTGQDGWYLAHHLHAEGTAVWALARGRPVPPDLAAFVQLTPPAELADLAALERAVAAAQPGEVYHLAARSAVAASWDDPVGVAEVNALGTARLLEATRRQAPAARVFVASSSEIFGDPDRRPLDESAPIRPTSPYGAAKAFAHHLAAVERRRGRFVATGILFNHESPRRSPQFVTRKITQGAVAIARGERTDLRLGNLDAVRDWGFAGDYVRAMPLMLRQPAPDEYVIATGEAHTVREWCELAFARCGLDYRDWVVSDPAFWRPAEPIPPIGDASKARRALGWAPTVGFAALVAMLVEADLALAAAALAAR